MTTAQDAHCPRCTGPLGELPAGSRLTTARDLDICAPCGADEAARDAQGQAPIPPHHWPLNTAQAR